MKQILAILQLVPAIIEIIKTVETMFPIPGAGKEKLALVRGILGSTYEGLTEIWPTVETIISRVVEFANAVGAFSKSK
jgi:hypothetical protein